MHGGCPSISGCFAAESGNDDISAFYLNNRGRGLVPGRPRRRCPGADGVRGGLPPLYLVASVLYALAVLYPAVRQASALSRGRMAAAAVLTLVFVGCLLYLWAF